MGRAKKLSLPCAGALLLVLGCAGGLVRSPGASAEEVAALKRQIVELQRQARVDEVEVARLKEEIAALEKELAAVRETRVGETMAGEAMADTVTPPPENLEPEAPIGLDSGIEETELEDSIFVDGRSPCPGRRSR